MFKWKKGKDIGLAALDTIEAMRHHDTYRQDWHAHPFWETHYILSGRLTYEFAGRAPVTILGGAFLVIPPNTRHCAVNTAGTPSVHLGTRWYPPLAHTTCSPFTASERKTIFATLESKALTTQSIPSDLMRDVRELFAAVENDEADIGYVRLLAWTVLSRTARAARIGSVLIRESDDAVVRAVADRIRHNCGGKVRISELVAFSGYSQTRFFALFRAKMGLSPNQFLTRCRIDRAKQLLTTPNGPSLQEIALSCGFATASHFAATFRRYEGVTPSSMKRR
jgi:AraC-like DNA-binding protein/mannose-6-phosphate isomerase-like protein (cupin superfamily)